jgi:hypothetical protein
LILNAIWGGVDDKHENILNAIWGGVDSWIELRVGVEKWLRSFKGKLRRVEIVLIRVQSIVT